MRDSAKDGDWRLYFEGMIGFRERALEPRHAPAAPAAPSADTLNPPTMPVWELCKPVLSPPKGTPNSRAPARRGGGPSYD